MRVRDKVYVVMSNNEKIAVFLDKIEAHSYAPTVAQEHGNASVVAYWIEPLNPFCD